MIPQHPILFLGWDTEAGGGVVQRDLAAAGERASEKDRLGALCSSVWSTPELLIAFLLGRWLGSQGFPYLGNPFGMAPPFVWLLWPTVF